MLLASGGRVDAKSTSTAVITSNLSPHQTILTNDGGAGAEEVSDTQQYAL